MVNLGPRLLILLLSLSAMAAVADAAVYYVAEDGDDVSGDGSLALPFATIQTALDGCIDGDEVLLISGTFTGVRNRDLDFAGKAVRLASSDGDPTLVTIDCEGSIAEPHRLVLFQAGEDSTTVIEAVTIVGGYAAEWGGAVWVNLDVSDAAVMSPRFRNCVFENNSAGEGGGAVCVGYGLDAISSGHRPIFEDCRFLANSAPQGGAIYASWRKNCELRRSAFYQNTADEGGAIFLAWESSSDLVDCEFRENTATLVGGAVVARWEQYNRFRNCRFVSNSALDKGGAVYNPLGFSFTKQGMPLPNEDQFVACEFDSNQATQGGAMWLFFGGWWVLQDCTLRWNTASGEGGAIWTYVSRVEMQNCLLHGNEASNGSAVKWYGDQGAQDRDLTLRNCTIVDNLGGGAAVSVTDLYGCGLQIESTIIAGNDGPAYELTHADSELLVVTNNDIVGNAGGDWIAPLDGYLGVGLNIAEDPMFCDGGAGEYGLMAESPCAPGNHPHGGTELIGALGVHCSLAPRLLSLVDVPGDNGGQLRLIWKGSHFDQPGSSIPVTGYGVYRREPPAAPEAPSSPRRASGRYVIGWDFLTTVPARGDTAYQVVATTLCDSTDVGVCMSTYMISAMTADPYTYWDSAPDSGYSVDNLAPAQPTDLVVTYDYVQGHALTWVEVDEDDLRQYSIYRGSSPDFEPSPDNLVGAAVGGEWTDTAISPHLHYRVSTVDHAGNESEAANPILLAGVAEVPVSTRLIGAWPNPFNPRTAIVYELERDSAVTIRIYDVSGRLVDQLAHGAVQRAGRHSLAWDGRSRAGRPLAAGRYLYVFEAAGVREARSLTLLK